MEGTVTIKVKYLSDKPVELVVNKADTIGQVKEKLSGAISVPAAEQKLICKGKILKDEEVAGSVFEEGTAVHAVMTVVDI